jgi:hypothetical protein
MTRKEAGQHFSMQLTLSDEGRLEEIEKNLKLTTDELRKWYQAFGNTVHDRNFSQPTLDILQKNKDLLGR